MLFGSGIDIDYVSALAVKFSASKQALDIFLQFEFDSVVY